MLAVLNRPYEFKLHIRGALNNGISKEEIREIILQIAVYGGMPAALEGFRLAKEVFVERAVMSSTAAILGQG